MCKISIEIIYIFQAMPKKHEIQKDNLSVYTVGDINEKTNTCKYSCKHFIVVYCDSLRHNAFSI